MPTDPLPAALREAVDIVARALAQNNDRATPDPVIWASDATAALRALLAQGWVLTPPDPFKDWGRVG